MKLLYIYLLANINKAFKGFLMYNSREQLVIMNVRHHNYGKVIGVIVLFFVINIQVNLQSQNLLPNPSFESYSSCPNNYNQVSNATGWQTAVNNNNPTYQGEYMNSCGTSTFSVPSNTWGNQVAANGQAYMTIGTMAPSISTDFRENIYIQLTTPLTKGRIYDISFKVSHTDNSKYSTNNLGAKFATVPSFPINNICQIYSPTVITTAVNWVTISGSFVADSAYSYMCIGNFYTDANTTVVTSCAGCPYVLYGYFWDDFSLTAASFSVTPDARFTSSAPGCLSHLENFYSVITETIGVTHSWDFGVGATPPTSSAKDPVGIIYSSSGAKLVTHIVTTNMGADTITNIITINPVPSASCTSTAPACIGSTVNFTNTGSSGIGYVYNWDLGDDAMPVNSGAQNPVGIEYSSAGTKTITQYITNQFGCTTILTKTISIDPLPVADAGMDTTICANTTVQIGSAAVAGNSYSWFPVSILNSASVSDPVASPTAPNTQLIVTVNNATTGCINHDTTYVTMLPPIKANAGIDVAICKNDSVQIGSALVQGQTYSWDPLNGLSNATDPSPTAQPSITTTYTVSVFLYGCGPVTDDVTVIVHPLPLANAGVDDTITTGNSVQLVATGGIQYVWTPAFSLSNAGINDPVAHPETATDYIVTVTDLNNCVNYDTVHISVLEPLYWLPNSFTPGNNGLNDVFYVRGRGIANFEFTVFDRWGAQIFYSKDMNTGWDGTKQGTDKKMPEGAYVFIVRGILSNGEIINNKGLVNLIR